ncbi:MAG: hypothetical protein RL208_591 [Pseudomonadota bacterium]|jgi:acetolactate synthase-1/2/3 large subunit
MTTQKSGSFIVFEVLKHFNVKNVFGYPGGAIMPLYDELVSRKGEVMHYLMTHEQGATHAAEGYARTSENVGVVFATSGPGATNTVTGIADAKLDSVPLVVITANVASYLIGTDAFQEINICEITKCITKKNFFVNKTEDIQKSLYLAFKIASSGRKGPTLVDITKDALINKAEVLDFSSFNTLSYE